MEKKNTSLIVIIVVLAICVLALGGYLVYDNVFNKNSSISELDTNTIKNKEKTNTLGDDEIEALGRKLYEKTSIHDEDAYYFYNTKNINYSELYESQIISAIFNSINFDNIEIIEDARVVENFDSETGRYNKILFTISKSEVNDKLHELFGLDKVLDVDSNIIIKINNEKLNDYVECNTVNNSYVCYPYNPGGGSAYPDEIILSYNKTELVNNNIVVYTKVLTLNSSNNENGDLLLNVFKGFYGEKIGNYIQDRGIEDEEIWHDYNDKAQDYKLTFIQDTNGNYYWYSTELVN